MKIEFTFKNMPVGYFTTDIQPRCAGIFSYMPCRGAGHYEMQEALEKQEQIVCSYTTASEIVSFVVVACPEYGKLKLTNFVVSPK